MSKYFRSSEIIYFHTLEVFLFKTVELYVHEYHIILSIILCDPIFNNTVETNTGNIQHTISSKVFNQGLYQHFNEVI